MVRTLHGVLGVAGMAVLVSIGNPTQVAAVVREYSVNACEEVDYTFPAGSVIEITYEGVCSPAESIRGNPPEQVGSIFLMPDKRGAEFFAIEDPLRADTAVPGRITLLKTPTIVLSADFPGSIVAAFVSVDRTNRYYQQIGVCGSKFWNLKGFNPRDDSACVANRSPSGSGSAPAGDSDAGDDTAESARSEAAESSDEAPEGSEGGSPSDSANRPPTGASGGSGPSAQTVADYSVNAGKVPVAVRFPDRSSTLSAATKAALTGLVKRNPGAIVTVVRGYSTGKADTRVAKSRAVAVASYLKKAGLRGSIVAAGNLPARIKANANTASVSVWTTGG